MPRSIDELLDEAEQGPKGSYKPARGEEAIFAAPEKKGMFDLTDPVMPFLMAMPTGMANAAASLLIPGYSQLTGEAPWRDPQGSVTKALMDAIFVASGYATGGIGRGMNLGIGKAALRKKGPTAISKVLEEAGAVFGSKHGGLPAVTERGFTHRGAEEATSPEVTERLSEIARSLRGKIGTGKGAKRLGRGIIEAPPSSLAEQKLIETVGQKQLPQYAGPTAPRGIPQPYAPQSWRERTFPGTVQRAQDVIEDLFRESLRAKGLID